MVVLLYQYYSFFPLYFSIGVSRHFFFFFSSFTFFLLRCMVCLLFFFLSLFCNFSYSLHAFIMCILSYHPPNLVQYRLNSTKKSNSISRVLHVLLTRYISYICYIYCLYIYTFMYFF